jgi:heliorhodopsin
MATKNSPKTNRKPASKITTTGLQQWNKYLAVLYAAQGLLILLLSVSRAYPVTTSFLGLDTLQTQVQGHTVLATATQHLFDINLVYVVAAFLFVAAIAHGLVATNLRSMYERDLKKGINRIRWIEYAFSASIMLVAIALLVGVQDVSTLLVLFGLTAIMNLLALMTELRNQDARTVKWFNFWLSCAAGVLPWVVLAIYLIGGGAYGAAAPGFVYWIFGSLLVLSAGFPTNLYLQYRKFGNWTNYLYGERVFMVLGLVAKTALAWQIFAGNLHP